MPMSGFIRWVAKHPRATPDMLGYIPGFLNPGDPRPAKEQIDQAYKHGGGWQRFDGFEMVENGLLFPGDPPMRLLYEAQFRDETLRFYECSWFAIVQPDGSFEVARLD